MTAVAGTIGTLVACLVVGVAHAWADGPPPPPPVHVEKDRVDVHVHDVALDEVLRQIATASGAEISGGVRDPHDVTLDLDDASFDAVFHRLLGDQNFTLTFAEDGRLKRITLLGGPQATLPPTQITKTQPVTSTTVGASVPLWQRQIELPPNSAVAKYLGGTSVTVQQLVDVAMRGEPSNVRMEAIRAGLTGIEREPDAREQLTTTLAAIDDNFLQGIVQNVGQQRAREVLAAVALYSTVPEVRSRTQELVKHLQ